MMSFSSALRVRRSAHFAIGAGIVFFVIAANVIFSLTVLQRQVSEIAQLERSVSELRHGPGAGRSAGYPQVKVDVETFKKRLPNEKRMTRVVGDILSAAKRNGLVVPTGDYGAETSRETGISQYTITFPVEGRYPQIKKFIYEVETLKYSLAIEDITLTSSKALDGNIGLKIRVSVYFL